MRTNTPWSVDKASAWYAGQPWLLGCNFIPSSAINQLEMWQAETFDLETIRRELSWARELGFNSVRVFLHDLLWQADSADFLARIDRFLALSSAHGIRAMFVLFDGVWDPFPKPGPQRPPRPRVHNSGWVQSPGAETLADRSRHDELAGYVRGIVAHFRADDRVLAWDLFNEPDNPNPGYRDLEARQKAALAGELLANAFRWAREAGPAQPITAGVWRGEWRAIDRCTAIDRLMLSESDIISFHSYEGADRVRARIDELEQLDRPVLLTEYLARPAGSTFEAILPLLRERKIGAYNWGLVAGKTQTIYPWDSWRKRYTAEPEVWFHDLLRADGSPYRSEEADFIRRMTGGT